MKKRVTNWLCICKTIDMAKINYQHDAISVEEKKQLFLVYEAVSMAVRLASSPFSLLHLPVVTFFLKVGLDGWIKK